MPTAYDVIVVDAGIGGIYAVHRLTGQGLAVVGVEGASGVGGVWHHNRYPGARVDLVGIYYSYFDPDLYREWRWAERYPSQPELLAYLNFAADRWDVKRHFPFNTWVTGASFDAATNRYTVTTDTGRTLVGRFLVMATGPLSAVRMPSFPGLGDFRARRSSPRIGPTAPSRWRGSGSGSSARVRPAYRSSRSWRLRPATSTSFSGRRTTPSPPGTARSTRPGTGSTPVGSSSCHGSASSIPGGPTSLWASARRPA
jgi:phytoene dehydrogenase-like protein